MKRIRRKRCQKNKQELETEWENKARKPFAWSWVFLAGAGIVVIMISGVIPLPGAKDEPKTQRVPVAEVDPEFEADMEVRDGMEMAEDVAKGFLAERDPYERLRWVRDADDVMQRLEGYSMEAREAPGEIEALLGHVDTGDRVVTAFSVSMPSDDMRLLEVLETAKGPKVDWDAYARFGTASWEDLSSGKAKQAVVRVFCEPSSERPAPFGNQAEWTAFRLSSPDLPQAALGFAHIGTAREAMMKRAVLDSPRFRQRFTLEIMRHEGKDEPLFEITRCKAVGWIVGERDAEDDWGKQ